MKLTQKQETFCQQYMLSSNASKAYRHSYNTVNMKPATINRRAKELIDNSKIGARISVLLGCTMAPGV